MKASSDLTGNTQCVQCNKQSIDVTERHKCCLLWETYEYNVWQRVF